MSSGTRDTEAAEATEPTGPQPVVHDPDPDTGAIRITLAHPIERKGREPLSEVTIRRLRGKDMRATCDMRGEARTYELAIRAGALMPGDLDAMDIDDLLAVTGVVDGFF